MVRYCNFLIVNYLDLTVLVITHIRGGDGKQVFNGLMGGVQR
ncbi:hypothetical protein [Nostoc sp.]